LGKFQEVKGSVIVILLVMSCLALQWNRNLFDKCAI